MNTESSFCPKVAIYTRCSTQEQSLDSQLYELENLVKLKGWNNLKHYKDVGSGAKAKRHGLANLIEDVKNRNIDIVVCYRLDRLFRSLKDLLETLQIFSDCGVAFLSLKDDIDLSTSSGNLIMAILGAIAQYERELIASRVKSGIESYRSKGKIWGRPKKLNDEMIWELVKGGKLYREVAKVANCSLASVSRAVKKYNNQHSDVSDK